MASLIKYHLHSYMKSNKYLMPLVSYLIVLGLICSSATPKTSISSLYIISIILVYLFMIWSGFAFAECEDIITEQIVLLKTRKKSYYYITKIVFAVSWGAIFAIASIILPSLWKLLCQIIGIDTFYGLSFQVVLTAFIIHLVAGMLGAVVGFLWHPRIMVNRKIAGIGAFSLGVLGIIKGPLSSSLPFVKYITVLLPPVYELANNGIVEDKLSFVGALIPMVISIIYTLILGGISVTVINKKGF